MSKRCVTLGSSLLGLVLGCATIRDVSDNITLPGPFAAPPPAYKSQYGLTPTEKVDRLRHLASSAASMSAADQVKSSRELVETFGQLKDPIMRREVVRALGSLPTPEAQTGIIRAANDEDPHVRIAAANAFSGRDNPEAISLLGSLLTHDPEVDVRIAASRSLGTIKSPRAMRELGIALKDRDPAIQLTAIQALKSATGVDVGKDVNQWIAYVEQLPSSNPLETSQDKLMIARPPADAATR